MGKFVSLGLSGTLIARRVVTEVRYLQQNPYAMPGSILYQMSKTIKTQNIMKTTKQAELASSTKLIKTILLTTCLLFCSFTVWGQAMRIDNTGRVHFGDDLRINRTISGGATGAALSIDGMSTVSSIAYGVFSRIQPRAGAPLGDCVGVFGEAFNPRGTTFPIRYIGVWGTASGGSAANLSIGTAGIGGAHGRSVGIFGGISSLPSAFTFTGGPFAGYFMGPVNVRGTLTANSMGLFSDESLKRNIQPVNDDAVERLFSLRPIKYHLRQIETPVDSLTTEGEAVSIMVARFDEASVEFNKMHFGLIAQELEKVFPDLVFDGGEGFLAINYIGLIPIMLKAIQRQQQEIDELRSQRLPNYVFPVPPVAEPIIPTFSFVEESLPTIPTDLDLIATQNKLFQNVPNPFNRTAVIDYRLAENAANARIGIFNLNGRQLLSFELPITQREGSIEVCASSLQPGMYIYALIVDGVIIDTKRMVLMD